MFNTKFGIEIEFTGITRKKASDIVLKAVNGVVRYESEQDNYVVKMPDGRKWEIVKDGSIDCTGSSLTSVELVSPILKYEDDIDMLQEICRKLANAGAVTNKSCGIHIHLDGAGHNEKTIRNFVNIMSGKGDLLMMALDIHERRKKYCKKFDKDLVEKINKQKTLEDVRTAWYENYGGFANAGRYNSSRYHFLNLHAFFTRHHTLELRGFNSTLHAGKVRAYIMLALALNNQAMTQSKANAKECDITEAPKKIMGRYLTRIGVTDKNCRKHLLGCF